MSEATGVVAEATEVKSRVKSMIGIPEAPADLVAVLDRQRLHQDALKEAMSSDPAVVAAKAEVQRWLSAEIEWSTKQTEATRELGELEAKAGAAILDGADAGKWAQQIAKLKSEAMVAESTILAARERRRAAIPAVGKAEGAVLRLRAAEIRETLSEHQKKTNELLEALKEHDGVMYVPEAPEPFRPGAHQDNRIVTISRTAALLNEISNLEQQAAQREARGVSEAGHEFGKSIEDLTAKVLANPFCLGPLIGELHTWAKVEVGKEQARRSRLRMEPDKPLNFDLHWRKCAIDLAQSRVGDFSIPV